MEIEKYDLSYKCFRCDDDVPTIPRSQGSSRAIVKGQKSAHGPSAWNVDGKQIENIIIKDLLVYLLIAKYVKSTAINTRSQDARRPFGRYRGRMMTFK
jgi:hypothetical protein